MTQVRREAERFVARGAHELRLAGESVFNRYTIGIWLACSAFAAFSGPFGTYQSQSFFFLLLLWIVLLGGGIVLAFVTQAVCRAIFPHQTLGQINLTLLTFGALAISYYIDALIRFLGRGAVQDRPGILQLWIYVASIMLVVILVRAMISKIERAPQQAKSALGETLPASLPPQSRLAQRINIPSGVRIYHISADGHFIDVRTCTQPHRLRMRFSDAVAELDGTVGLIIHRSHWVHRDSIRGWVPNAAKPYAIMENDAQIPVSKTYFKSVKAVGLVELPDINAPST